MEGICFVLVMFCSLLAGAWLFPQIIGTFLYWTEDPIIINLIRIISCSAALVGGYFLVNYVIGSKYIAALYIGYGIMFMASFSTKRD